MNETIAAFREEGRLALVGVSSKKSKFGNSIFKALKQRGLEVLPVHRTLAEIEGQKCYRSIGELPAGIESLVICTHGPEASLLIGEARSKGIKRIWFQQGADYSLATRAAREADIDYVTGKCILMYAGRVTGIHAVHRFFAKLVGRY